MYLITALAERWRQETQSFHMPHGEMTITLQDMSFLLGLPIDGEPLCMRTGGINWRQKIEDFLGVPIDETTFRKDSSVLIKLKWLAKKFDKWPEKPSEMQIVQHARAFMLAFLGDVLFTDHFGDCVSAILLTLLEDMHDLGRFNWGSGVLAYLYRELCRSTRPDSKKSGGCVMLMQLWSLFGFPIARPTVREGVDTFAVGYPPAQV